MTFSQFTDDNKVVPGIVLIGPDGEPYKASFVVQEGDIDVSALAKEAKQDSGNTSLAAIDTKLGGTLNTSTVVTSAPLPSNAANATKQDAIITALNNEYALLGAGIGVTVSNASIPITATSLPLPTGAATSAKQDTLQASIDDGIDVVVSNTVPVTMANRAVTVSNPVEISNTSIAVTDGGGSLTVDGTVAATQSGTWTSTLAGDATVAVSTIGSPVAVTDNGGSLTVDGTVGVSGVVQVADNGGSITVDATALPLPTGAATSANQSTEISSLSSIDTKTPALGQAAKAASIPITIASDQGALAVSDNGGSITVDNGGTAIGVSLASVPTHAVTQSGTWTTTSTPATLTAITPLTSAATANATVAKASAGNLFEVTITNPTATAAYFKVYNKATAPTVGTDVPIFILPVSANSISTLSWDGGKRFATGISYALTGAITVADTTASVAGILISGSYI